MIGWEFPPLISGGLGTACAGLVHALAEIGHEIVLLLPEAIGVQGLPPQVKLIRASEVLARPGFGGTRTAGLLAYGGAVEDRPRSSKKKMPGPYAGNASPELGKTAATVPLTMRQKAAAANAVELMLRVEWFSRVAEIAAAQNDFDIIHCHDWLTVPAGLAARRVSGKSLVLHVHSLETNRSVGQPNRFIFELEGNGLREADHVLAVSNRLKSQILSEYRIGEDKLSVVHNGVFLSPPGPQRPRAGEKSNHARMRVGFLGRMTAQKGPGCFLAAAARVLQDKPETEFVMAGTGDLLPAMKHKVRELGLADAVKFAGFVPPDQVLDFFRSCQVAVVSSLSEPFGIVALEAALAGTPVIVPDCAGVCEVLTGTPQFKTGGDADLAHQIELLLKDHGRRRRVIRSNNEIIRNCGWQNAARKIIEIYQSRGL
jgi:glycosyltransferase involved in cell wall biosynthesis